MPATKRKPRTRVTVDELAHAWKIEPASVEKFLRHGSAPPRGPDGRWNLEDVTRHRIERLEKSRPSKIPLAGTIDGQRVIKLGLEIDRLRLVLDREREKLIPVEEVLADLQTYAHEVNETFAQGESAVAAMTHDARLTDRAEELTRTMRQRLADRVQELSTAAAAAP